MDYELWFFILMAFIVGRVSVNFRIYVGSNVEKYKKSTVGVLLKNRQPESGD
jgi:hypothetical protein